MILFFVLFSLIKLYYKKKKIKHYFILVRIEQLFAIHKIVQLIIAMFELLLYRNLTYIHSIQSIF